MNDMRKLMETICTINEGNNAKAKLAFKKLSAKMKMWHAAIANFQKVYDPESVGLEGWMESDYDTMYEIESELDDEQLDEEQDDLDEVDSRTEIAVRMTEYIQKEIGIMRRQQSSIAALAEIAMNSNNTASAASLENVQGEMAQAMRMLSLIHI